MTDQKDEKDPGDGKPPTANAGGKIAHDARGNAVWQWASSTTRQALDSTSRMLQRLEVPGLSLLDDPKPEDKPAVDPAEALKARRESGFDPYEGRQRSNSASQQKSPAQAASKAPPRPVAAKPIPPVRPAAPVTPPARPGEKPSLLGRLFGKDRDR